MSEENIKKETEFYQDELGETIRVEVMEREMPRSFDGIWIPKFIWFNKKLKTIQKCIFAEIHSLDTEKLGCYASNKYFSNFFGISEQNISRHISKLKRLGYIYEEKFDGRKRILRSSFKKAGNDLLKNGTSFEDLLKTISQTKQKQQSRLNKDNKQKNIFKNIINDKLSKDNKGTEVPFDYSSNFSCIKDELFKYFNLYKTLHPLAKKEMFFTNKKIKDINRLCNYILNGFPKDKYNNIRAYIQVNNIPYDTEKGLNGDIDKLKKLLNNALLCLDIRYEPSDKRRITSSFIEFLMNKFTGFSYFFTYGFTPPQLLEQKIKNKNNKEIILNEDEKYAFDILTELNCFNEKDIPQLSVDLYKKYYSIMYRKIQGIVAKEILEYKIGNFESFCNLFKKFVKKKKLENEDLEPNEKFDFKMYQSLINQNKNDSRLWNDFVKFLDDVHGINFKVSESEINLYKKAMEELAREN